jgi:Sulfotransferase family
MAKTTIHEFHKTPKRIPLRLFNKAGKILEGLHLPLIDFSPNSILREAYLQTGLHHWSDESSREGLKILVKSLDQDAQLTWGGRFKLRNECIRLASNHLRIENDFRSFPEILDVAINRPIFILGMPRTGTTFLHHLMALDKNGRTPRRWELAHPSPPPSAENYHTDPRIEKTARSIRRTSRFFPQLDAVHSVSATSPDECHHLFMNGFRSPVFSFWGNVKQYLDWFSLQDMSQAYEYYHRQLQLLGWRFPGNHWVLKGPSHLSEITSLLKVFPDAQMVLMQRDPAQVIGSLCSFVAMVQMANSDNVDLFQIGQDCLMYLVNLKEKSQSLLETVPEEKTCRVNYPEFIADPLTTVKQIYERFELEFEPALENRVRKQLVRNSAKKRKEHRYLLEPFGLTQDIVRQHF